MADTLDAIRRRYPRLTVREVWSLAPGRVVLVSTSPPVAEVGVRAVWQGPLVERMLAGR